MENMTNEEILNKYKEIFDAEGPEKAEAFLVDSDVNVVDLPDELAQGIREFLESKTTEVKTEVGEVPEDAPETVA